jgi:hypothetical protein
MEFKISDLRIQIGKDRIGCPLGEGANLKSEI